MTTDIAVPDAGTAVVGLEDFDESDSGMPRISINHKEGMFVDSLSNEQFPDMDVVILGLVKQRVLWPAEMGEEGSGPQCRSNDNATGNPYMKEFPWADTGFDQADIDANNPQLDCAACPLKEWGTDSKPPRCTQQYVFIVMRQFAGSDEWSPALLTVQKSSIKGANGYISVFSRARLPMFTSHTVLSLEAFKRGNVAYAVVKFVKGTDTATDLHELFADNYRQASDFLRSARRSEETEEVTAVIASTDDGDDNVPF